MAKILNLDALAKEKRELTFDGETYPVVDMSVESYIEITRRAEESDARGAAPFHERLDFLADTILMCVPTCPKEKLLKRSMEELNVILAFVKDGELPEALIESEGVEVEKKTLPKPRAKRK